MKIGTSMGLMVLVAALLMGTAMAETATVSGNVDAVVEITTPPAGSSALALDPTGSPEIVGDSMLVKSTTNWKVDISDEDTTDTAGKMTKYDTSTSTYDNTKKLATGMQLDHTGGGTAGAGSGTTLPTDGSEIVLVTGGATGVTGTTVTFDYDQASTYADTRLTGTNVYRIVVTFAASTTG